MSVNHYVVATIKPWNIAAFKRRRQDLSGSWTLLTKREELTLEYLKELSPRYVFLPHWSWRVPDDIVNGFECVCFHMTDLPYGRGGSPLQNLILRGHCETVMTALKMTSDLDAGPIYQKRPLSLEGSAQTIFERAAELVIDMMIDIVRTTPWPVPQKGLITEFHRRIPSQSQLPQEEPLAKIFDFIRMLDAETYPHAFIEWGDFRLEFSKAKMAESDMVEAQVTIRRKTV